MSGSADLLAWAWTADELPRGLALLAGRGGAPDDVPASPGVGADEHDLAHWMDELAAASGAELEPVPLSHREIPARLRALAPVVLPLPGSGPARWLLLARAGRRSALLLTPAGPRRIATATVVEKLRQPLDDACAPQIDALLDDTALPPARRARTRAALLGELVGGLPALTALRLRPAPGAGLWAQLRRAGLGGPAAAFLATYLGSTALFSASWWLLGRALEAATAWLLWWSLALLGYVVLRTSSRWLQEHITVAAGAVVKRHLLYGATRLHPDAVRHQGVGQLMGSVIEADNMEYLLLNGGFPAFKALLSLAVTATILSLGATGWLHVLLLVGWLGLCALLGWHYYRERTAWNEARLAITHDQIEQMVGYRTLLAQQPARLRSGELARALAGYEVASAAMDHSMARLIALMPRGWLLVSLVLLAAVLAAGANPAGVVVGLGATLLGYQALTYLNLGLAHAASLAYAAWRIRPFLEAARAPAERPAATGGPVAGAPLLDAHGLSFRYRPDAAPVLDDCSLTLHAGDRVLLEGRSGSGKSTLVALLAGLRQHAGGALRLRGAEAHSLQRARLRRLVAVAPQFHENHLLTGTLAFNLLLGRGWPASADDIAEAEQVCRELGLGELLDRMPAGLQQVVGETGWQLSHGERSRVYLARALLQGADLVVLDESFAALDPETMRTALGYAAKRAPSLLVVAHP